MIGKRIVLYLIGITILLGMTVFVVGMLIEQSAVQESIVLTVEEGGVVSAEMQGSEELAETAIVNTAEKVLLRASLSSPERSDLIVVNGGAVVGRDSRRGEYLTGPGIEYQEGEQLASNIQEVSVSRLAQYDESVSVYVVGLEAGEYVFSGVFISPDGSEQSFSFASSTKEAVVDEYEFDYQTGVVSVVRRDYDSSSVSVASEPVENCDVDALTQQLTRELVAGGWDIEKNPPVNTRSYMAESVPDTNSKLPFGYEEVCAVEMSFMERFENEVPENYSRPTIVSVASEVSLVTVGSVVFGRNPADGPLGSSDVVPITKTGNEVQFLGLEFGMQQVLVGFPMYSTCPCSYVNTAVLTAPMYPASD